MIIRIEDDMNLDRIAASGQCFRWRKTKEGGWLIPFGTRRLRIAEKDQGVFEVNCGEEDFEEIWKDYLDLRTNYRAINAMIPRDEDRFLYEAMESQKGIRMLRQDPWEMLITSIITQNRNIPAIERSVELICSMAGDETLDYDGNVFFTFPKPDRLTAMTAEDLDKCRLGYRTGYVSAAARAVANGDVDLDELGRLPDDECMERLTAMYGIGNKVASCVLLFGLHRMNAFPVDVWVKRILADYYPDGYPMEKYSPWNGIFQQYMFAHYRETHTGKAGKA